VPGISGGPDSKGEGARAERTAPGGGRKDAMMRAASASARCRGEPAVDAETPAGLDRAGQLPGVLGSAAGQRDENG
jgi:hypothetical protein